MVNVFTIRHARKEVVDIRHLYTQQCHTHKNNSKNKKKEEPRREKLSHLSRSAAKKSMEFGVYYSMNGADGRS